MGRFRNLNTSVTVSVADDKDHRFATGWVEADSPEPEAKRGPGRPKKSDAVSDESGKS